jgi:hypothetical protein
MTQEASPAIEPMFPPGELGDAVTIYEGSLSINGCEGSGRIDCRLMPRPSLAWRFTGSAKLPLGPVTMTLPFSGDDVLVDGECNGNDPDGASGTIPGVDLGRRGAELDRVVVNWLNVPQLRSPGSIYDPVSRRRFAGRWTALAGDWRLTLDARPDHRDLWRRARDAGSIVTTHVMEIRRDDGATFAADDVEPVLDALQLGLSFALGRMVSPILPTGLDPSGNRVWCQWSPRHCTAGAPGALRWWFEQREWELAEFLNQLVTRFADPEQRFSLRFLLTSAVLSAAGGFVEQRVMTAFAAIEHFAWTRLVATGESTRQEYDQLGSAGGRLAAVLTRAGIPCDIDRRELPALHDADTWLPPEVPRTGPGVAAWVRNKIVHPTSQGDVVYRHDKLLQQTWFLANHYLVLLILHDLGYRGCYQRRLVPEMWAGDVEPVPWSDGSTS